jgi:hypothetical protein
MSFLLNLLKIESIAAIACRIDKTGSENEDGCAYVRRDRACGGSLYEHLRHGGRKYRARFGKQARVGCIPNRTDIAERPAIGRATL